MHRPFKPPPQGLQLKSFLKDLPACTGSYLDWEAYLFNAL